MTRKCCNKKGCKAACCNEKRRERCFLYVSFSAVITFFGTIFIGGLSSHIETPKIMFPIVLSIGGISVLLMCLSYKLHPALPTPRSIGKEPAPPTTTTTAAPTRTLKSARTPKEIEELEMKKFLNNSKTAAKTPDTTTPGPIITVELVALPTTPTTPQLLPQLEPDGTSVPVLLLDPNNKLPAPILPLAALITTNQISDIMDKLQREQNGMPELERSTTLTSPSSENEDSSFSSAHSHSGDESSGYTTGGYNSGDDSNGYKYRKSLQSM